MNANRPGENTNKDWGNLVKIPHGGTFAWIRDRRRPWNGISSPYSPLSYIRRWATHPPLVEGAAYGTVMVERRVLPDRRTK